MVIPYYRHLNILPDFSSFSSVNDGTSLWPFPLCDSTSLPSPVILPSSSHYHFYTDGSLINLGSPEVSMGWSWVQIIHDAGYLNSVATYAHGTIRNWPSSTRAEAAAIYTALSVSPADSTISIYTDSQAAIDSLRLCASSSYTNSHDGNYWNEFADSLANSAHHSDDAIFLPVADYTSSHNVRLVYDDVVCKFNPRRLLKLYYQASFMKDLLSLKRFQFTFCLCNRNDYVIDWELTWFTLNFSPVHDASFRAHHASRHHTFKFKLFLDDLPLLEKLKITHPDLYIGLLTQSAIKVVAAIHNNFVQKLRTCIWNPRTYDKCKWEDAINITLKLKTTPRPSNLPATSRKANHHKRKKDNNNSDNSGSNAADVGVDGFSSPPKKNNTASTSLSSPPNITAALSAPDNYASGGLNVSMHARTMTPASLSNASPDKATANDPLVDQISIHTPTFSIKRNDY
ncbi:hypothetical protein RclHR1_12740004 [Rhizophagus clarus]|uniref:Uncharacterized protein n=1 Tax=Rhizophagus clarus TaxID=94130 RepID=A0A2Z6R0F1_9GLOM|nr:hypothetical protein RclHR1_12740004 [Rhizophagus clarus]